MEAIEEAKEEGMSYEAICDKLEMSPRRLERWKKESGNEWQCRQTVKPYNAMTEEEKSAVCEIVADKKHADESTRGLSVRLMEERNIYVSHVSIWAYERSIGANGHRGHRRYQSKRPEKPDVDFATGPNQLWSWDITKLRTGTAYVFFYLVAILDTWSRKTVSWLVGEHETSHLVKQAWDIALVNEELTQTDPLEMPQSLSDRGSQMRSLSTSQFFKKLGIIQLFARPRTPNDNAKTESLFSTVKTFSGYPKIFQQIENARDYFDEFFRWYNDDHLHTSLEMMTPSNWHSGRHIDIRRERNTIKQVTFNRRREQNLGIYSIKNNTRIPTLLD